MSELTSLRNMDNRFESVINKRGNNFSEGEKQLVGLARCLYKDFEILILDEMDASLSKTLALKVFQNLMAAYRDKIIIYISHRPELTELADVVIGIEDHGVSIAQ